MIIALVRCRNSLSGVAGRLFLLLQCSQLWSIYFHFLFLGFYGTCHSFPIRMKLQIIISRLCTNEHSLFHCSIPISSPCLFLSCLPGKHEISLGRRDTILGIQYFLFLSIALYLHRREVNHLNKENAYYGYAGQLERQNRRILLGIEIAALLVSGQNICLYLGQIWFKTKTNSSPSMILTPAAKKRN